jgi:hypothetical protein
MEGVEQQLERCTLSALHLKVLKRLVVASIVFGPAALGCSFYLQNGKFEEWGYLQLEETLDRAPTLKEFGKSKFARRMEEADLGADTEEAWTRYENAISVALAHNESTK